MMLIIGLIIMLSSNESLLCSIKVSLVKRAQVTQTKHVSMPTHLSVCLHRVFGFSPVVQINCSHTWKLIVHSDRKWYHFVNPIMLLILYYTVATLIRLWLQEPLDQLTVRTEMKQGGQHSCNPQAQNCSSI